MSGQLKEIRDLPTAFDVNSGGGDYLHIKQGDSDRKITVFNLLKAHNLDRTTNPHGITKDTVLLGEIINNKQLIQSKNFSDVLDIYTARKNIDVDSSQETSEKVRKHADKNTNPHKVTKSQVGLSKLYNWGVSSNPTENSDTKYATIGAVREAYYKTSDYVSSLVGEVKMWMSEQDIPKGYIEIKGQPRDTLIAQGFPKLAELFPKGLVDTRGYFPRGLDSGRGVDTGRGINTLQEDDNKSHHHTTDSSGKHTHSRGSMEITGYFGGDDRLQQNPKGGVFTSEYGGGGSGSDGGGGTARITFTASRSWTGNTSESTEHNHNTDSVGSEARPKNFSVIFIIKTD